MLASEIGLEKTILGPTSDSPYSEDDHNNNNTNNTNEHKSMMFIAVLKPRTCHRLVGDC